MIVNSRHVQAERPSQDLLDSITQPVLLIHVGLIGVLPAMLWLTGPSSYKGDSNEVFPPDGAFIMQEQLVNAKDGAKLYFVRGACT